MDKIIEEAILNETITREQIIDDLRNNKYLNFPNLMSEQEKNQMFDLMKTDDKVKLIENIENVQKLINQRKNEYFDKKYIKIKANQEKGFYCDYFIYIPDKCEKDTSLIVECANNGHASDNLQDAIDDMKKSLTDPSNITAQIISEKTNMPLLIPIFPRIKGYNTHSLSSDVYDNLVITFEGREKINQMRNTPLSNEKFDIMGRINPDGNTAGMCVNLEEQLTNMIKDSKERLSKLKNMSIDDKIILEGFSAGSKFACKYANDNPNMLKGVILGGTAGIERLESLRDTDTQILITNGKKDSNDLLNLNENGKSKYPENYSTKEVIDLRKKYGNTNQERFQKEEQHYKEYNNAKYNLHENYGHEIGGSSVYVKNVVDFISSNNFKKNKQQEKKKELEHLKRQQKINLLKKQKQALIKSKNEKEKGISKKYTYKNPNGFINILIISILLIIFSIIFVIKMV